MRRYWSNQARVSAHASAAAGVWHGHYNVGLEPARYLAIQPPQVFSEHKSSSIEIQYTEEEAWVRERFESELAERGLTSLMPPEIYTDPDYRWSYRDGSG